MRGIEELDHYELLEIGRSATSAEVDRAYRTAQQTYAEGSLALYSIFESFDARVIRDRLDDAYRVLADPELRAKYHEALEIEAPVVSEHGASGHANQPPLFASGFEQAGYESEVGQASSSEARSGGAMDNTLGNTSGNTFGNALVGGTLDDVVEEFDAIEDEGRGEFDGIRLRRSRLFRGYEIDDISDVTKISGSHLRNIEAENFVDLPADVYVRGFVKAYAQTIGLDPKVVVPSYMARVQARKRPE